MGQPKRLLVAPDGAAQAPLRGDAKAATKPTSGRSAAAVGVATFVLVAVARSGATLGATASALARRGASDDDAVGAARRGAGRRGDRAATRGLDDDITNPFNLSGTPASNASASGLPSNFSMTMDDDLTSLERCASYDDDATYTRGSCASCDHAACFLYCTGYCDSMCGDACGGNVSSGAMCALDTLNNLESVCEDGGFCDATSSASPPTTASVAASSCTGCDSHALCSQCVSGDEGALCMHLMDIDVLTSAYKAMILISDMNATCAAYACKNQTSRSSARSSALLAPGALPAR